MRTLADTCLEFAFPGIPSIACVFTTRATGNLRLDSPDDLLTIRRRQELLSSLGLAHWSELNQVHGTDICGAIPTPPDLPAKYNQEASVDGQMTDQQGLALLIKTADCQPLLLAHPAGCVAALHVGWRGNLENMPAKGVAAFCERFSLQPEDVCAVRGPSLGWAEFRNFSREWPQTFARWFDPEARTVDLWGLTRHQLQEAGLVARNIYALDLDTLSLSEKFFSHRRGSADRQGALIWVKE